VGWGAASSVLLEGDTRLVGGGDSSKKERRAYAVGEWERDSCINFCLCGKRGKDALRFMGGGRGRSLIDA